MTGRWVLPVLGRIQSLALLASLSTPGYGPAGSQHPDPRSTKLPNVSTEMALTAGSIIQERWPTPWMQHTPPKPNLYKEQT